jgi:uncharacterized membrane protein YgdD (TMEM256/DUF423 family)
VLVLQPLQHLWRCPIAGFALGIGCFSFSLYALVLTEVSSLAMITPMGGLLLIISWLAVVLKARQWSA